jgi:ABC-type transporter Mla subunit MlaD
VTLSLDKDVQLREGAYGDIKSLGMLGDKYIELFPGSLQSNRLNPGARLEGRELARLR